MMNWTPKNLAILKECIQKSSGSYRGTIDIFKRKTGKTVTLNSIKSTVKTHFGAGIRELVEKKDVPVSPLLISEWVKRNRNFGASSTFIGLCNHFNLSPSAAERHIRDMRNKGYTLNIDSTMRLSTEMTPAPYGSVYRLPIKEVKNTFLLASIADLHFGSKYARPDALKHFIDRVYELGVREVCVSGDIFDGMNMYPGHEFELDYHGVEDQLKQGKKDLPYKKGLTYHIVAGNHDKSFHSRANADICKMLSTEREDVKYYGIYTALLRIKNVDVEIHHPDKAGAYAVTYHLQREIEATPGGMKPQIALYGHTHTMVWMPGYRNIEAFYSGCFQDQTPYLRRKHISPVIGGWLLKVGVAKDGTCSEVEGKRLWYPHAVQKIEVTESGRRYDEKNT